MKQLFLAALTLVATIVFAQAQIRPPQYILLFGQNSSASGSSRGCGAGAIDLSLATGCNLSFYLNGIFP